MYLSRRIGTYGLWAAMPFVCWLFLAAPAAAQGETAPQGDWTAGDVKGSATVRRPGGATEPLQAGASVSLGSEIETGAGGRVVLSRDGDAVTVTEKSRMTLPAAETGGAATRIKQAIGMLLFKVHTRPSWGFEVQTPTMVAVVKGTTFTVSVKSEGTALHVAQGAVQVASAAGGGTVLVRPGQTARVSSSPGAGVSVSGKAGKPGAGETQGSKPERRGDAAPAEEGGKKAAAAASAAGRAAAITAPIAEPVDVAVATGNLVDNGRGQAAGAVGRAAAGQGSNAAFGAPGIGMAGIGVQGVGAPAAGMRGQGASLPPSLAIAASRSQGNGFGPGNAGGAANGAAAGNDSAAGGNPSGNSCARRACR